MDQILQLKLSGIGDMIVLKKTNEGKKKIDNFFKKWSKDGILYGNDLI